MTADPPPHFHASTLSSSNLRVATYNIHKGVRGVGPRKRLEIHNLGARHRGARRRPGVPAGGAAHEPRRGAPLPRHQFGWPEDAAGRLPGARGLRGGLPHQRRPPATASTATRCCRAGRSATSATTTSPTTASSSAACCTCRWTWNGTHGARHRRPLRPDPRQPGAPGRSGSAPSSRREVPRERAADRRRRLQRLGRQARRADDAPAACRAPASPGDPASRVNTFPVAHAAVLAGPHLHRAASAAVATAVPRGAAWARMSDHLPLVAELALT